MLRSMKLLTTIDRILLLLLGTSTGLVKIFGMAEEMQIFAEAGFSYGATVAFGVFQLVAALMLLRAERVRLGAGLLLVSFVVATGVLFVNGIIAFGLASLLFIAMAGLLVARPPA